MITIVCTNKRRHRSLQLQRMEKVSGVWCEVLPNPRSYEEPGDNVIHIAIGNGGKWSGTVGIIPHRIECRRCRRDTRVNPAKLAEVLDMIAGIGASHFDMSDLKF